MASTLSLGLPGDRGSKLRLGMTEVQMPPYKEARFLSGLAKKEKKTYGWERSSELPSSRQEALSPLHPNTNTHGLGDYELSIL